MSAITLRSLSKKFGAFTAVDALSLEIADGAFVALLGPSGCGKTTTMNMIAGIEEPTAGDILFDGKDLSHLPVQERNIGFVFQNYAIFTHLTVYKNLAYGLEVKKVPKTEIDARVQAMAKRMSISHRLDAKAGTLSVNEMQKLAIGRSAVTKPRMFLLDEPLSNLDASFRAYMRAELKVLQAEFQQTMIYVTHDQIEAMSLADKIAVIDQGKLMQYGTPLEVYNDPHNIFVANFIGSPSMNLLRGEFEMIDDKPFLRLGTDRVALSKEMGRAIRAGGRSLKVALGVRPHDVYFGGKREKDDLTLDGHVDVVERVGPKRVAHVQFGHHFIRASGDLLAARSGDRAHLHVSHAKSFLFCDETGRRLNMQA